MKSERKAEAITDELASIVLPVEATASPLATSDRIDSVPPPPHIPPPETPVVHVAGNHFRDPFPALLSYMRIEFGVQRAHHQLLRAATRMLCEVFMRWHLSGYVLRRSI